MKTSTKDSGMRAKEMDTEYSPSEMVITLKVTGLMISGKVKAVISITIRTSFSLENG